MINIDDLISALLRDLPVISASIGMLRPSRADTSCHRLNIGSRSSVHHGGDCCEFRIFPHIITHYKREAGMESNQAEGTGVVFPQLVSSK